MSINHYSSLDLPETTLWWTQNPQQQQQIQIMEPIPNPSWPLHHHKNLFNLNNNEEEEELEQQQQQQNSNNNNEQATSSQEQGDHEEEQEEEEEEEKEPMFEKPLTPSDVGKLNRLVIPKQHAEKYFPLSAASASASASASAISSSTASDSGECKGLLLSFEDESGKCWRFRYSYWNSSQSYVLTKGWSRYVKDKRLDAGDVVSFERHRGDSQRLFIRWRRRSSAGAAAAVSAQVSRAGHGGGGGGGDGSNGKSGGGSSMGWTSGFYCAHPSYPTHHHQQQLAYHHHQQHEGLHAGKGSQGLNQRTRPILGNCSSSSSSSKVLRLFGVNMECQPQHDDDSTQDCSYNVVMPSSQVADNNTNHHQNLYHNVVNQPPNSYSNSNSHMLHQQPYYY